MPITIRLILAWAVMVQILLLVIAGALELPAIIQQPIIVLLSIEMLAMVGIIIHDNTREG